MKRALCIVLDSVGYGHAPDAAADGDAGASTLGHLFERTPGFSLPALANLANLVDFDSLYAHRRDPAGYARCLQEFDRWLGGFITQVHPDDLLILTADHGNDPYHAGTDHTREQVPVLTLGMGRKLDNGDFSNVARWIEEQLIPA